MRNARNFLLSLLLGTPLLAAAIDVTGIWIDPRHPGWGLDVFQQNDKVFATFLTYDASGAPTWLFASNLIGGGINLDSCGSTSLTGLLYRGRWPGFASPASPQGVGQAQPIGGITINRHTASGPGCDRDTAIVSYTIDGAAGVVPVMKMTWASELPRFVGGYTAGLQLSAPQGPCPDARAYLPEQQLGLGVFTTAAAPGVVHILWFRSGAMMCEIVGPYSQAGRLGEVSGAMYCGATDDPAPPSVGTVVVSGISISDSGFSGDFALTQANGCVSKGALAGAKFRATP